MIDYRKHFQSFCEQTGLDLDLSFAMPIGYQTANGTYDHETKTVYINVDLLQDAPDYEQAFYLYHELRHAWQYARPEDFAPSVGRSLPYTIMYDGTCYKLVSGRYVECKLEGGDLDFAALYLGQPYEVDANEYAYEQVKERLGDHEGLRRLFAFWTPRQTIPSATYEAVYAEIDAKTQEKSR